MTLAIDSRTERELARQILTEKQFAAWDLIENHGMSLRQAANYLDKDHTTVRAQLRTAERKLRTYNRSEFALKADSDNAPHVGEASQSRIAVALLTQRDGPACYLCGHEFSPSLLEVEHVIPRSAGGTDDAENLALACSPCNLKKGLRMVAMLASSHRPVYYAA